MGGSKKGVGLDILNAGDDENKDDLGDVYNGGGHSNDDEGVDYVDRTNNNGRDDAEFGNGDSKLDFSVNVGSCDDDKDDCGVANSDIGNDATCGDGRSKVDCTEDVVVDDGNSKSDGGGDTNYDGTGGDDSDVQSNDGADGHKTYGDDDDGYLNSVKNCFKNKQIVLENFSLPDSSR